MKKYLALKIVFVLSLFVFLESARAEYNWQQAKELSEGDYALLFSAGVREIPSPVAKFARVGEYTIALKLQNGETVLAGAGEKRQKNRKKQETATIPDEPVSYEQEYGYSQSATSTDKQADDEFPFKQLALLGSRLYRSLAKMHTNDKYDFTNTDKLFSEAVTLIEKLSWESGDDNGGSLPDFRFILSYGKRYGIPGVEVISRALNRFPENKYLQTSFEDAVYNAIRSTYASETDRPSAQEIGQLAQKLLEFYKKNDNFIPSIDGIIPVLSLAAPDVLRKIEVLYRARNAVQKEKYKKAKEEAENGV